MSQFEPLGKCSSGSVSLKSFVVDPVVFDDDAGLRDAGGAAGLENVGRFAGEALGNPALDGSAAEVVVFEEGELLQVFEAIDVFERIELERFGLFEPVWASRFRG